MSALGPTRDVRGLGLAIGAATGPAGGFAQSWSGVADGRWHVWALMTLVGALLGALALPLFADRPAPAADAAPDLPSLPRPDFSLPFLALFGFAVAVVAGTFAAFPVGASVGSLGGAAGGVVAGLVWRIRRLDQSRARTPATALVAAGAALVVVATWLN
ncbi:MAG: hypothetical protein U1F43_25405 [Myxococcota bacterium]